MRARRRQMQCERGMTLVEVCVAMFILVTGVVGAFGALDGVRTLGSLAEKKQQAARLAQQEIETLRSMGWASLQLSSAPAEMNDTRGRVVGTQYATPDGGGLQDLVIAASCPTASSCVNPGPTSWAAGNASGTIYRYITTDDDTTCGAPCTATVDRKRVTVAVTINAPANLARAIVVSTMVIDPSARPNGAQAPTNPVSSTGGSSIGSATGTTYYLTDTPVGTAYAAPSSAHAARDTVSATGVPDQLQLATPSPPADGSPTAWSYSSDVDPGPAGGRGIEGSDTCGGTTRQTAHQWVTPVINGSAAVTATGNAAITLPTVAWDDDDNDGGRICLSIYSVALNGSNQMTTNTLLGTFTYSLPVWPSTPDVIALPFRYLATGTTASIPAGRRLGLRITVDEDDADGLTFIYDHPNYPASVQLETQ